MKIDHAPEDACREPQPGGMRGCCTMRKGHDGPHYDAGHHEAWRQRDAGGAGGCLVLVAATGLGLLLGGCL